MANSEARERVLQAAEKLFVERGYNAVTVKDIAREVGIHHASLYHHIPDGKAALFIEVATRNMQRHLEGIQRAIEVADNLRGQLQGIAAWLLSQPPVDVVRFSKSDLPAIAEATNQETADRIATLMHQTTLLPMTRVLKMAQDRGEIDNANLGNMAGALFSAIEGLHSIPDMYLDSTRQTMANQIIDVFVRGMQVV
ncbi:MAG: TetR/AcrR family transcriptional regulator [Anaerolineae bacterium]|nr:TetR/AcrR family transcriptional regulator [Anaerolineae bacterium]MCA9896047.1 TetR/AcrR family transcriptional regulator [Anaerolineae bacterium]